MLSDLSVRRPIFAAVAAIILCVIGLAAFAALPIRELPNVDPPVVSISTSYRGASAEVIEERITQVIERQVSGVQGIDRVNSSSRDGQSRVNITFTLDTNLETATNDVRDAVSRVLGNLPDQADPPQIAKANADSAPILILNMSSTTLSRLEIADYADRYLVERLSTIPGVATVRLGGAPLYSMRIWLDADAMAARGLTVDDVETALSTQNVELPAGSLESQNKDFTIRVNRGYSRPEDFAALPVRPGASAGSQATASTAGVAGATATTSSSARVQSAGVDNPAYVTRLGDIARIEEGADETRRLFRGNGVDQIGIVLSRQSQANDLKIAELARAEVEEINKSLPTGTKLVVAVDSSQFTSEAIHEVWVTMGIALALVALVNFVFLGSWRAALIPSIVAPICLMSTFIVLAPMGFSLNLLTLLALVLSIGLVVDDAIVVVENIQRRIDDGEPPTVAAMRGTRQVFFAVVATTIVLISVFAPLMFLPGYIGRLFVELAVAIAAAVAFSALLALSLSPMMASKLLRPAAGEGWLARKVDAGMARLRTSYHDSLDMLLGWRAASVGAGILVVVLFGLAALLFTTIPQELVPNEDRGRVDISINGPEGAGYDYTLKAAAEVERQMKRYADAGEAERYVVSVPRFGNSQFNTGNGVLVMKGWGERSKTSDEVAAELNQSLSSITGVRAVASVRGPFQRGGGGGGANVDLIALGNDYAEINRWLQPILAAAQRNPGMARPRVDYEPNAPRLSVDIDRDKAAAVGVSAQSVGRVLETMFGSRQVGTYIKNGQEYDVIVQTELESRRTIEDLNTLYVRSGSGSLIPLSSVVTTKVRGDIPDRPRVDRLRAITLTMQLNPGYTVAEAISFLEAEAAKQQSTGVTITWGGQARDFLEASGAVGLAFGLALLLVFLVLAAQFESWIHPAVIMLTVPLAALGGLFGLLITGSSINTYSQIGLVILIGIAAKNGILIVEFANQMRDEGKAIREAVIEAASLRLRPIIMTSIASAFGALPLVLWQGAGAESRKTIGVVIFFGILIATMLTLFIVPVFYNLLARFTKSPEHTSKQIEAFEEQEAQEMKQAAE